MLLAATSQESARNLARHKVRSKKDMSTEDEYTNGSASIELHLKPVQGQ